MNKFLQSYLFTIPVCSVTGFASRLSLGDFPKRYNTPGYKAMSRAMDYGILSIPVLPHVFFYDLGRRACELMDNYTYLHYSGKRRLAKEYKAKEMSRN